MDRLEMLWAMEEIRQLKARYFRFLDTKDWVGMRTIWTADAVFDARDHRVDPPTGWTPLVGREEIVRAFRDDFDAAYATELGQRVASDSLAHVSGRLRLFVEEHIQVG